MQTNKMHKLINVKLRKGIALVEVIAALGIAVVVITSLVSLSLFTLRSSLASKLQLQGTKVATRESELIRSYRDATGRSWEMFLTDVMNCYGERECCVNGGAIQASACVDGVAAERVTRSFMVTNVSGGQINPTTDNIARFNIKASWTVGGATKVTHIYTDLTNWRSID